MIQREQYKEILSGGGGGSGATQNEIYQIFEGTNPQGKINSLFETLSGNLKPVSNLLIENQSGNFNTAADLLHFIYESLIATRQANIIQSSTTGTINQQAHNVTFANVGNAVGTITVNSTTVNLPVGATLTYNAGGIQNKFPSNEFSYNATGTTFLITFVH